jgi:hypothetical protein
MSIWKIASIKEQPSVRLYRWKIMKMEEGSFFAGDEGSGSGRVSTDIVEFDSEKNIGRTESGRVYELVGEESPNLSMNADYVWTMYKDINRLTELASE